MNRGSHNGGWRQGPTEAVNQNGTSFREAIEWSRRNPFDSPAHKRSRMRMEAGKKSENTTNTITTSTVRKAARPADRSTSNTSTDPPITPNRSPSTTDPSTPTPMESTHL